MSKAILVIDMPSNYCQDCRLRRGLFCGENGNSLYDYIHNDDSLNDKPNWCPLKPILSREDIYEEMYLAYGLWQEEDYERMKNAVDKVFDKYLGEE